MAFLGGIIHVNKPGLCILAVIVFVLLFYTTRDHDVNLNNSESGKINLRALLETSVKAAENGGKLIIATKDTLVVHSKGKTLGVENSVTTADFLSHCSMVKTISKAFPNVKIVSEEATTKCDDSDRILAKTYSPSTLEVENLGNVLVNEKDVTVWVDPLDATLEFTEKLYEYVTTMVCIAVKGHPVIGVIHQPFSKVTSWAWVGHGKSDNLNFKESKSRDGVQEPLKVLISRSHAGPIKDVLKEKIKEKIDVVIAAGAGYKALKVAAGEADAYLHVTAIMKWDTCAGDAIIKALGGTFTTKFNRTTNYDDSGDNKIVDGVVGSMKYQKLFVNKL